METWKKLIKQKSALFPLLFLIFSALMAIYAPLIANNKPFIIYTDAPIIYTDYLDGAQATLELILNNWEKPENWAPRNVKWVENASREAAAFLKNRELAKQIRSIEVEEAVESRDRDSLEKLRKLLEGSRGSALQKRFFFPVFKTLTFSELFFIFLPPLFLLAFGFRKKIPLLIKTDVFLISLSILILAFMLSFALSRILPSTFDPYSYKEIAREFEEGEWAVFPLVPYGENENIITESKQPPTLFLDVKQENQHFHLLGTDTNGRDVLARMVYGARISMSIGFVAVGISVIIGIFFGALAGFYGGWVDISISRFMEIVICFPVFFLILTVMAFLQPSIVNIMIIIGLTGWPGIARLMRGEFLRLRGQEFVLAARALGASDPRIMLRHILPNGLGPIFVAATFGIAGAILTESALSFLGFGVPQPTASWGDILNNGRNDIYGSWWLTVFPGIAIFLTVTSFNLIGESLRDILDPRLRGMFRRKPV